MKRKSIDIFYQKTYKIKETCLSIKSAGGFAWVQSKCCIPKTNQVEKASILIYRKHAMRYIFGSRPIRIKLSFNNLKTRFRKSIWKLLNQNGMGE